MNHTEYTLPRAGRTVDRMTADPGWAAWRYERSRMTSADRALLFLAAVTVAICWLIYWGVL